MSGETPDVKCNYFFFQILFMFYKPGLTLEQRALKKHAGATQITSGFVLLLSPVQIPSFIKQNEAGRWGWKDVILEKRKE